MLVVRFGVAKGEPVTCNDVPAESYHFGVPTVQVAVNEALEFAQILF